MIDDLLTARQAAAILGVHPSRVRQLCGKKLIPAQKWGQDWMIPRAGVEAYQASRPAAGPGYPAGRPRKKNSGTP